MCGRVLSADGTPLAGAEVQLLPDGADEGSVVQRLHTGADDIR